MLLRKAVDYVEAVLKTGTRRSQRGGVVYDDHPADRPRHSVYYAQFRVRHLFDPAASPRFVPGHYRRRADGSDSYWEHRPFRILDAQYRRCARYLGRGWAKRPLIPGRRGRDW